MPNTHFKSGVKSDVGIEGDLVLPVAISGDVANGQVYEFEAPWALDLEQVSVRAGAVTNPGDGDVTVDVLDDGVSVLTAPLSVAAAATTYKEAALGAAIAAGSIVRIAFALSGTGPALTRPVVTLTGHRNVGA